VEISAPESSPQTDSRMHYRNIKRLRKILRVLAKHG